MLVLTWNLAGRVSRLSGQAESLLDIRPDVLCLQGRVWTFARDRYGKPRPERGERWDQAELSLIRGLCAANTVLRCAT
jgi:hypothetical protein